MAVYRSAVVPHADVLTPNQFELEQLTEAPVRDMAGVLSACEQLHDRGVTTVVRREHRTGVIWLLCTWRALRRVRALTSAVGFVRCCLRSGRHHDGTHIHCLH